MNNKIIVIYKEVGKRPQIKKIQNKLEVFEELLGGTLDYIPYKDITIIARKNRKKLQPNVYLNTTMLNIRERNVRGNIIVTCGKNGKLKSLTKEQAMQYQSFLQEESFWHNNFNENGKQIQKHNTNKSQFITEKEMGDNDTTTITDNSKKNTDTSETLKMILAIQAIILKFVKKNEN